MMYENELERFFNSQAQRNKNELSTLLEKVSKERTLKVLEAMG